MANKSLNNEIEKLVSICRAEESNLLMAKLQLTLNQWLIKLINDNNRNNNINNNSINYLRQLLRKCPSIKIVGDKTSTDSTIYLSSFSSCTSLELIRVSFKRLIGLETIRSQLKSLTCIKSIDNQHLDEEFWDLFGVWPLLVTLKLSQNNIVSVNASIIPSSVQTLDLSWNRIKVFNNIANYSVNSITKLDLSFNSLTELPKLNNITCTTLKTLFIRGNLIESIDGIEKLVFLQELDIAINCIIDSNSMITCLKQCKSLKSLWVEKNPFSCDRSVNELIKQELPHLLQLDGLKISSNTVEKVNSNKFSDIPSDKEVIKTNSDEECDDQSFCTAYESQIDGLNSSGNNSTRRKKLRVVKIKDQSEIDEDLERLVINGSDNVVHSRKESLSEAKELKKKREELGDEWLVSLRPSFDDRSFLSSAIEIDTSLPAMASSISLNISPPVAESTPKVNYLSDEMIKENLNTINDEDIEVIAEEKTEWSRKELENDTNIIIVECPDTNETIFLYVREEDGMIFEKDCVSGRVLRTHDLKVLTSVDIINNLMLKLCFDSRVNSKRERKYVFDSIDSCHSFNENFIIPWISNRKQRSGSEQVLYECLKCGLNKMSELHISSCPNCGSDVMMRNESRRRRSGSDITILSQNPQQMPAETMPNVVEETNVWDEIFSVNNDYDNSFFTRVDHSLKLYIELQLFSGPAGEDEVVEGLVECRAMTESGNKLEKSLLVISSKKIMILTINQNEKPDNFESYLKVNVSKPITSLIQVKHLPNLLTNQGFWIEFKEDNKEHESSKSRSFINRFSSKRSSLSESSLSHNLVVFDDELIGKSFLSYFNETVGKLITVACISSNNQKVLIDDNSIAGNDELIIVQMIESGNYKRNDMRSELKLSENIAIIVTEEHIILGELHFDFNLDYRIKVLYKELIINLLPQIYVNIKFRVFKLSFSDDNIETEFVINSSTTDSMKKILAPIKSQWEKTFDVPMPLFKF